MIIRFQDEARLREVKTTPDGYKVVRADVARTGIQEYRGGEIGLFSDEVVRVYRPEEEVFNLDSLNGWAHVPVTVDHPSEPVTPDNYGEFSVGEVSTSARVGDDGWLSLELIVKDARGIEALEGKHKEFSGGYAAEIEFTKGVTKDGMHYDAIQRNIVPNHMALVPAGRAFGDAAPAAKWGVVPTKQEEEMDMDTVGIVIGDAVAKVVASDADIVNKMISDHAKEVDSLNQMIGELKAECAEANAELEKFQDAAAAEERKAVVEKASGLSSSFSDTGQSVSEIMREAVMAKYGVEAVADATDAEIKGIWSVIKVPTVDDTARNAIVDSPKRNTGAWEGVYKVKGSK